MGNPYLSIVIPVYNEEENICTLYNSLTPICQKIGKTYEIIFVDDGSTDRSIPILCSLQEQDKAIKIIKLSRNHGHQLSLTAGLEHSQGDYTLTMDADLQHPPELIPTFLDELDNGYEIVTGVKKRIIGRGFLKTLLANIYYKLFKMMTKIKVEPNASDFRLYSRRVINIIKNMHERERYLRGITEWLGLPQCKIYYDCPERYAGKPKYTVYKLAKLASHGIFSFSTFPLRLSLYIGIGISFFNFILIIFHLIAWLNNPDAAKGFTTVVLIILSMFGWLFLALGILGEYIIRIYEEVKNRPLYIIDWKRGFDNKS